MNENENTTTQNLWDTVKAVLRGKFIAIPQETRKKSNTSSLSAIRVVSSAYLRLLIFLPADHLENNIDPSYF